MLHGLMVKCLLHMTACGISRPDLDRTIKSTTRLIGKSLIYLLLNIFIEKIVP